MSRKMTVVVLVIIAALILSACGSSGAGLGANRATAEEIVSASFNVDQPQIVVQTFNGDINVSTTGGTAVKVDVTKRGSGDTVDNAKNDLKNIQVSTDQQGNVIHVIAQRTDKATNGGNSGAAVTIAVPVGAKLDLKTSNGEVHVSGAVADVSVQTSNGAIDVRGATGPIDLSTSNGSITLNGGSGTLKLDTSNGAIDASTTSAVQVAATSANGALRFAGALSPKSTNTLRSSNALVDVTLPADASFTVSAATSNGKVTSDFPIKGDNQTDQQVKGTVGEDPQTTLTLETSNGDIKLHKGK
jgi:DUF4097 and DUF4098 domain-containing protein YvlB